METPSSMRRVSRSQSLSHKTKQKDAASRSRNKGNQERRAFLDITNDSPSNGLATKKTSLSLARKYGSVTNKTPGFGEALLRRQVKILLEKAEEEANTPLFFRNSRAKQQVVQEAVDSAVVSEDVLKFLPEAAESLKLEKFAEPQVCVLNRALQFDSPGKSEASDVSSHISSSVTYQGSIISCGEVVSLTDEENSSNWSIQGANARANNEDDFEDHEEEDNDDYSEEGGEYDDVEEEAEECGGFLDDLCEGLSKFTVEDKELKLPEFTGKHTKDDEIEGEEDCGAERALSPSVMLLKGLPVPEGKRLRFHEEDEEE